jgi:HEAT repeat protein
LAGRIFVEIADTTCLPAVLEMLLDASAEVRVCAVHALGKIADTTHVPAILGMLHDTSAEVRVSAVHALANMPNAQTIGHLMSVIHDNDPEVQAAAAHRIGELGGSSVFPVLMKTLESFTDGKVLRLSSVAHALARGWVEYHRTMPEDPGTLPTLIQALGHTNPDIRFAAVRALGEIGDETALDRLTFLAASDDYVEVSYYTEPLEERRSQPIQEAARHAIHEIKGASWRGKPFEELVSVIKRNEWSDNPEGAVKALALTRDARATGFLIGLLEDENMDVGFRSVAAEALGVLGDERAIQPLLRFMIRETSDRWRTSKACPSLAKMGTAGVEALMHALSSDDDHVLHDAATALGETKDERAVNPLIHAYHRSKGWYAREAIIGALGRIGGQSAFDLVMGARCSDNENEQGAALDAIIMLRKEMEHRGKH